MRKIKLNQLEIERYSRASDLVDKLNKIYNKEIWVAPTKRRDYVSSAIYELKLIKFNVLFRTIWSVEAVIAHEYAHHVAGLVKRKKRKSHHGREFFNALASTCKEVHPNGVYDHPWNDEYPRLRQWAIKEGWLKEKRPTIQDIKRDMEKYHRQYGDLDKVMARLAAGELK